MIIRHGSVEPVFELGSTQEEADNRLVLHAVYAFPNQDLKRIVLYVNYTEVI